MNKEQQQIIDEVYENYLTNFIPPTCPSNLDVQPSYYEPMSKEWFIKSIKERGLRGEEFSEKWGVKIEERELSESERLLIFLNEAKSLTIPTTTEELDNYEIPTRLITITYKNEKIESYES